MNDDRLDAVHELLNGFADDMDGLTGDVDRMHDRFILHVWDDNREYATEIISGINESDLVKHTEMIARPTLDDHENIAIEILPENRANATSVHEITDAVTVE